MAKEPGTLCKVVKCRPRIATVFRDVDFYGVDLCLFADVGHRVPVHIVGGIHPERFTVNEIAQYHPLLHMDGRCYEPFVDKIGVVVTRGHTSTLIIHKLAVVVHKPWVLRGGVFREGLPPFGHPPFAGVTLEVFVQGVAGSGFGAGCATGLNHAVAFEAYYAFVYLAAVPDGLHLDVARKRAGAEHLRGGGLHRDGTLRTCGRSDAHRILCGDCGCGKRHGRGNK